MRHAALAICLVPLLASASALGAGMHRFQLSAGSGVVHPTLNHATGTNPAGLMGVDRFKLAVGAGSSGASGAEDMSAGLLFGNESARWAGTVGASTGYGRGGGVFVGAATHLRSLHSALGAGYGRGGLNAGVILNPATINTIGDSAWRFGAAVYDAAGNASPGVGLEWDSGKTFSLSTDLVASSDLSILRAHPALMIGSGSAAFTVGYQTLVRGGSGGELTFGVTMNLSRVDFQFYYNQFDHLFLSLAVRL